MKTCLPFILFCPLFHRKSKLVMKIQANLLCSIWNQTIFIFVQFVWHYYCDEDCGVCLNCRLYGLVMSYCRNRFYKVKKIVIALCLQDVKVRSLESCRYPLFNCSIRNLQVEQPLKNGALAFYLFSCSNTHCFILGLHHIL